MLSQAVELTVGISHSKCTLALRKCVEAQRDGSTYLRALHSEQRAATRPNSADCGSHRCQLRIRLTLSLLRSARAAANFSFQHQRANSVKGKIGYAHRPPEIIRCMFRRRVWMGQSFGSRRNKPPPAWGGEARPPSGRSNSLKEDSNPQNAGKRGARPGSDQTLTIPAPEPFVAG